MTRADGCAPRSIAAQSRLMSELAVWMWLWNVQQSLGCCDMCQYSPAIESGDTAAAATRTPISFTAQPKGILV
jgi:hypothetical protein